MSKLTLSEVLIDATRLLESDELNSDERQAICATIRDLMGRETMLCNTSAQSEWLVAKAWAASAGSVTKYGRKFGARKKLGWERIRAILAEVPVGE